MSTGIHLTSWIPVRERVDDPVLVLDLGLGLLERARVDVACALVEGRGDAGGDAGSPVAVEERPDRVVG
jgi:hypothetical protein